VVDIETLTRPPEPPRATPDDLRPRFSRGTRRAPWLQPLARLNRTSDGYHNGDALALFDQIDRVRVYGPAMLAIRWGTSMVSVALAAESFAEADWWIVGWCGVLLAYTVIRTLSPLRYLGNVRSLIEVVCEVALLVTAVASTGYWASPFVFSLTTAAIVAGFARGFGFALRISIASALAISISVGTRTRLLGRLRSASRCSGPSSCCWLP
jgi:hypothetical protein